MKPAWRILIVGAICVAGLIAMVVRESAARASGTEILLAMEAVDPRALLQGHYVSIALRETREAPCPPTTAGPGAEGWVALQAGEGGVYHAVQGAGIPEEAETPGALLVRGGIDCLDNYDANGAPTNEPVVVGLDLGINAFYIAQDEALRIERILFEQNVGETRAYAIISVGRDHRARLKGLLVDGERLELNWN
ncbi:MAG: GDYXXLXY domain-containing protein [Hyphomonadaceae bacterium]|nr:GDYXXLXY domain-containing protein [Hyphomonadaceae bacterium]